MMEIDWQEKTLDELCSLRREFVEPSASGVNKYVGLEHIESGIPRIRRWGTDEGLRSPKSRFYKGDVLYGKLRPYLDKAALAEWDGVCSTDILTLEPDQDSVDSAYLSFLLHISEFLAHAVATTSGVNHPRTSWASLASFSHTIPSPPEQRAIAAVLAKIHAAVEVQDKIVATLKELKAATMAKLFREGLRSEPLKQTEIGEMPESWEVVFLGELCTGSAGFIQTGPFGSQLHASDYIDDGVPIVNPTHMDADRIQYANIPKISKLDAERLKRHMLKAGDILFSRRGDVGRHAHVFEEEKSWLCGTGCLIVRPNRDKVHTLYLSYFLSSSSAQEYLKNHAVGSIMPNINTKILTSTPVALPAYDDQVKIAGIFQALSRKIQREEERSKFLKHLFTSMLHLLMTGRVRVTILRS